MVVGCVLKENGEKGLTCLLIQYTGEVELECFAVGISRILSHVPSILYCGVGRHSRQMHEFLTTVIVFSTHFICWSNTKGDCISEVDFTVSLF
jgi:hypothetical protein